MKVRFVAWLRARRAREVRCGGLAAAMGDWGGVHTEDRRVWVSIVMGVDGQLRFEERR